LTLKLMIRPRTSLAALLICPLALLLAACSGLLAAPTPGATPALPSETPTETIVWFPPTNTPTRLVTPTAASTQDLRPGVGGLLVSDDFSDPGLWNTSSSSVASAQVLSNRLVLSVVGQGPLSILSLRSEPQLADFYLEITASLGLCDADDQYGILLRAAPGGNYYRFSLRCDGKVRLERTRSAQTAPLMDWLPSGNAPTGAPGEVRLGVWASGSEFRFFLNDQYQFSLRDPVFWTGTLGFYATAGGSSPVLVSFSDLKVFSLAYVPLAASSTPTTTPTSTRLP
jgi:hypothetical protein